MTICELIVIVFLLVTAQKKLISTVLSIAIQCTIPRARSIVRLNFGKLCQKLLTPYDCLFHKRFRRQDSFLHRAVLLIIFVAVGIVSYKNAKANLTIMQQNI